MSRVITYRNYVFRTALAAQWAVFFDVLGVEWRSDLQPFLLQSRVYTPDFYLPRLGFRSVQPGRPGLYVSVFAEESADNDESHNEFVNLTGRDLLVIAQPHVRNEYGDEGLYEYRYDIEHQDNYSWDNCMVFVQCLNCRQYKVEFSKRDYMTCEVCGGQTDDQTPQLQAAVAAAQAVPFVY
jgi:hypothetical protein